MLMTIKTKDLEVVPLVREMANDKKGVGIVKFFRGKNIFITGGTGLLGKALVEKILRSTPVGKIYVLVKADDQETALDRITRELINSELFKCLEEKHGKYYRDFTKKNLIPVVANTNMNERLVYDVLLDTNVNGPKRIMNFAKMCKKLELLVHISTAYVNGEREGVILENPMMMGENRRKETYETYPTSSLPRLNISDELNLASKSGTNSTDCDFTKDMKRLGMERANLYGWQNTYQLTKAMGEMVIDETRGDIPVVIIRPTVIESCYKEPIPGWIQGNRMFDPLICSYGKGQLPAFMCNPDTPIDIIPLDMVVNATIAAIAKHGCMHTPQLNVYQIASSVLNPVRFSDMFEYMYKYFSSQPLIESESSTRISHYDDLITPMKYFDNFDDLSRYTREEMYRRFGGGNHVEAQKLQKQCKAKIIYAQNLSKMYEFAGFLKARFHSGNTEKLLCEMSKEEKINFDMDATKIEWRKYVKEVHIPGLRKYVLKENLKPIPISI
ncbi:hypothetical protein ABFX02_07G103650 [Erythranthe guttata]